VATGDAGKEEKTGQTGGVISSRTRAYHRRCACLLMERERFT
jgi:hypothetical protein